jgi:hypothetical protein
MLSIVMALTLIPLFIISGAALGTMIFIRLPQSKQGLSFTLFALSLLSFFLLLSLSTIWSFGVFGANYLFIILLLLIVFSYTYLFNQLSLKKLKEIWIIISKKDVLIFGTTGFICLILCSNYIENLQFVKLATGAGPDVSQNLMAAISQNTYASTYSQTKNVFFNSVNEDNHFDAYKKLFSLSSMREVALVDYLIYGTRWGLTIPLAQILKLNSTLVISFPAMILAIGLFASAVILIGLSQYLLNNMKRSIIISLTTISSSSLLFIIFNGGMAQIFALPGLIGIIYSLIIVIQNYPNQNPGEIIIFMISSIFLITTYAEAFSILVIWVIIFLFINLFKVRKDFFKFMLGLAPYFLFALLLTLPFLQAFLPSIQVRAKGALGTGYNFNPLPLPSEILGFVNVWTSQYNEFERSLAHLIFSILLSLSILLLLATNIFLSNLKKINTLFVAFLIVMMIITINAYTQESRTNYAYVKTFSYFIPFLYYYIYMSYVKRHVVIVGSRIFVLLITLSISASTINFLANIHKSEVSMFSHKIVELMDDQPAIDELERYNYLTVYRPIANMIGVLSDFHWIARAPNVVELGERLDRSVRIICLTGDPECNTGLDKITGSHLEKYGFDVFDGPISTLEFSKLTPQERYEKSYKVVGQKPLVLPKSFIGGNPILDK